jgi:hypothetical protein
MIFFGFSDEIPKHGQKTEGYREGKKNIKNG